MVCVDLSTTAAATTTVATARVACYLQGPLVFFDLERLPEGDVIPQRRVHNERALSNIRYATLQCNLWNGF